MGKTNKKKAKAAAESVKAAKATKVAKGAKGVKAAKGVDKNAKKQPARKAVAAAEQGEPSALSKAQDVAVRYLYYLGMVTLLTFALNLLIVTTGFFVGITINWFSYPLSLVAATVAMVLLAGRSRLTPVLLAAGGALLVMVIGGMAASGVYDPSYDGNTYHKMAIGLLHAGWNPVYESSQVVADQFFADDQWQVMYGTTVGADRVSETIDHFAKATWFFSASLYWLFGNVEAGKAYNLLGMVCVFTIALPYLREKLGGRLAPAAVVALVLAMTPVCVYQYFDYYVDGFLGAMLFCLVIGLTQMIDRTSRFHGKWSWVVIFASMIVLGNVKATGLAYGGIFCIAFFVVSAVLDLRHKRFKAVLVRLGLFVLLAAVTACWAGFPTYVTNTIDHANPIYPIAFSSGGAAAAGTDAETSAGLASIASAPAVSVNIMGDNNLPVGYAGKPWWYTLFYSLFCGMNNNFPEGVAHADMLKVPFTITELEAQQLQAPAYDLRLGGWGPLFGGILIVALVVYVANVVILWKRHRALSLYAIGLLVFVVVLLAVVPTSWWARYSPYLYLVPVLAVFMSFKIGVPGGLRGSRGSGDVAAGDTPEGDAGAEDDEVTQRAAAADGAAATEAAREVEGARATALARAGRIYGIAAGSVLAALMLANSFLFFQGLAAEAEYSQAMEQQLEVLRGQKIELYNQLSDKYFIFGGFAFNLEDHNVDYSIVKEEDLDDKYMTYYNKITFGFPDDGGEATATEGGAQGDASSSSLPSSAAVAS